jgi:protein-S-isoprenylcysteine O-methyltransferase Ste14
MGNAMPGTDEAQARRPGLARPIARRIASIVLTLAIWQAVLLAAAGTVDWPRAWIYLGVSFGTLLVNIAVLAVVNPEVAAARGGRHGGTKAYDKVFGLLFLPPFIALPVVAGLDAVRLGWTSVPYAAVWPGAGLLVLGDAFILWSMAVNRHLEKTVRIQEERGHAVVTTGPYRLVRHPFYVGMMLQQAGGPLVLGSVWAFVPAGLMVLMLVVRTALEDRTLRRELAGYEDYARRTRWRLLPGVW